MRENDTGKEVFIMGKTYICIDLKSYYASVECVARNLDPLKAYLLVADESRSDKTICLAVSPKLKEIGVPSRPRLFEAKQKIREYERKNRCRIPFIVAVPRMAEYERISADIYSIYLQYVSAEDIHVYSIDECFIDATPYLHFYEEEAEKQNTSAARILAVTIIRHVLSVTGITATAGIGTNLYLAKVAMDIVAKKSPADRDGVRIAELDENSYPLLLWDHQPLTDFWQIGTGKARRLNNAGLYTMGDIAAMSQKNEEWFYQIFGIDGEILIDHAWGLEPVSMPDIKNYHSPSHSLHSGQVLPKPYSFADARLVFTEMIDILCADLFEKKLTTRSLSFWISYDPVSLEAVPEYDGPLSVDFYGRIYPKHTTGIVRFHNRTNSTKQITAALLEAFDQKVQHRFYIRRLGIAAEDTVKGYGMFQMDLFTDYEKEEKEQHVQQAIAVIRKRYGTNAVLKGMNLLDNATAKDRNEQIGGHKA
ncbi:MAG: DNA methylase [Solobacterium sp.]|nr:DNA methylase [Solobacterium sp.]